MYTNYITYSFSTTIGPNMFMIHETLPKKTKVEKMMQYLSIKSPLLWYGSGFILKIRYYYAFIAKQMQKNTFFE
jgi:hypothetical protein